MNVFIVIAVLLSVTFINGQQVTPFDRARQEYICANSVLDLIFVLDSSASIWEPDFYRQITFVENIVKQFEIGPTYTQVGAVTFGQTYWHKFHLNTYTDKKSLLAAIKRIRYRAGSYTNTGDAIQYMNEKMFSPEHGDRFLSRNIAVVITDGRSQETNKTKEMAAAAHRAGIKLFAIGVGKKVSIEELQNIASDPDWEHVFEVDNYKALDSIKDTLTSRTCYEITTMGPPTTPTPPTPKPTTPAPVESWAEDRSKVIRTHTWNRTIIERKWTTEDERLRLLEEDRRQKELEEERVRLAAIAEEQRRLRELEAEQQRLRDLEDERRRLEEEQRRLRDLEEEQRRLRDIEEEQRRLRDLEEQQRRLREQEEQRRRNELSEEQRRLMQLEADRLRREQEAELLRRQQEAEQLRRQHEADRLRREQEEAERLRRQQEEDRRRNLEEIRRRMIEFGEADRRRPEDDLGMFPDRRGNMPLSRPDLTFILPESANGIDLQKLFGRCNDKPADIYFVMDASSSIGRQNYKKQKSFLVNLVRQFDIGADKTRVGVISFSNSYRLAVPLGSADDITSLTKAIHNIPYSRGGTDTASALKFIRNQGFSSNSARGGAAHIAIILTDGYSRDPASTKQEAKALHDAGINTFVIGIGNGIDMDELRSIASDPDDQHLFQVDDFNALDSIKDLLVSRACEAPVNSIVVCQTAGPMDIVFMYDTLNLGRERTDKISNFIFNIVDIFDRQSISNVKVRRLIDNCPVDGQTALMSPRDFLRLRGRYAPGMYDILNQFLTGIRNNEYDRARPVGVAFLDSELDNINTLLPFIKSLSDTNLFTVVVGPEPLYNTSGMRNVMLVPTYEALDEMVKLFVRHFCTTLTDVNFNVVSSS